MQKLIDVFNGKAEALPLVKELIVYILAVLVIVLGAFFIRKITLKVFYRFIDHREMPDKKVDTVKTLFNKVFTVVIYFIALLLLLQLFGVNTTAFLALSSVFAIAFSLGAQDIVRDYISGFLFIIENQYNIGDFIEVKGQTGRVETLNLRTTSIRSADGTLHIFPNSEIDYVSNITKDYSMAVIEVEVDYESDVDHVIRVLNEELSSLKDKFDDVVDVSPVNGIASFNGSGLLFRLFVTCCPETQWMVGQKVRVAVKNRFDRENIQIPYPHQTISFKGEGDFEKVMEKVEDK